MAKFDYLAPSAIDDAIGFLSAHGDDAKVIAGGQSLLPMLREGVLRPSYLVSLDRISGLAGITLADGTVTIGAMTTLREIEGAPLVKETLPLLAQAVSAVASPHVRNLGTIGGNISHNYLGGDPLPALIALEAMAEVKKKGESFRVPLDKFTTGYLSTILKPGELVTSVHIPIPRAGTRAQYLKLASRVIDRGIVNAAVLLKRDGRGALEDIKIALGGVAARPFRSEKAEDVLRGRVPTAALIAEAGQSAAQEARPISDAHASASYRRQMIPVMIGRAIHAALEGRER